MLIRRLLWSLSVVLLVTGLTTLYGIVFPLEFGSAEWEVGVVSQVTMAAPTTVVGWALAAWLAGTSPRGRWVLRVLGLLGILVAVMAGAAAALVALNLPLIFEAARQASSALQAYGLKAVAVKAIGIASVFAIGYFWVSAKLLRVGFNER